MAVVTKIDIRTYEFEKATEAEQAKDMFEILNTLGLEKQEQQEQFEKCLDDKETEYIYEL